MSESVSDQPREVTPRGLLDIRERAWSARLRMVSLATEYQVVEEHRDQTLEVLGGLVRKTPGYQRARLLTTWPAVHVLSTIGVATDHYKSGTFWPKLSELIGLSMDQTMTREWGTAFIRNLAVLGLPTFEAVEDAGTRYVGRILMHSGMPTYCLSDYFQLINERRRRTDGITPGELVSWAAGRAAGGHLHNVDMPVVRFLKYGGEFAVDVTDRSFDLLDSLSAGGSGADVMLPERFKFVARGLHKDGKIEPTRTAFNRGLVGIKDAQPRLVIDAFGQGLLLRLPAVGDAPDGSATWLVGLDAITHKVGTQALFPGSGDPAPQTVVAIPGPVRVASVALLGRSDLQMTLSVVDDNDPILAFGDDGVLIPSGLPLPDRPTWLLLPGDPSALTFAGSAPVVSESPLPPGWAGWCLVLVDLEHASSMTVNGKSRAVRTQASARVIAGESVRGTRTATGEQVLVELPTIQLPEQLGDAIWDVSLLDASGDLVARWNSETDEGVPDSVWDDVPRPVVGTYTVRVRGPWGRGVTRALTIVQGLQVSFDPPWRRFVKGGLQPCTATVGTVGGVRDLEFSRTTVDFKVQERENDLRVGAYGDFRTLLVTPPHMSIAYQSGAATTAPSVRPLRMFREEIAEEPGTLVLDIGSVAEPRLRVCTNAGVVQIVEPGAGRAGVYSFNLARIVDTLETYAQTKLTLDDAGELVVATVRPKKLFSDVSIEERSLRFTDCVEVDGLTALVYQTRAPWAGATVLPISAGQARLAEHLLDIGPLRVAVRIDDPWAPLPIPDWPEPGTSKVADSEGFPTGVDDEATALSTFLAGEGDLPEEISNFARLWTIRGLIGSLALGSDSGRVVQAIEAAVYADPKPALTAINASGVPSELIPALTIQTGLAWANLEAAHDDQAPAWTVRGALPATLLSAADGEWSAEEIEVAASVCGEVVEDLLRGLDPYAKEGRLDDAADRFDAVPPAIRAEIIRQAGLVPSGILSGPTRVIASMKFIEERRDERLQFLVRNGHKLLADLEKLFRMIDDPVTSASFRARSHITAEGGWRIVPTISLGLAFAARHAVRGNETAARWLPRQARPWADLALVVPPLVTTDLILAELLVASSTSKIQELSP